MKQTRLRNQSSQRFERPAVVQNGNTKRAQFRAKACELRENAEFRAANPQLGSVLNVMAHCKLPNDAPQCCCMHAFQRHLLKETPDPVVYFDSSQENQQLKEQLREASAYRDMFATSQLELRKTQDERDRLTAHVKTLEDQIILLTEQNAALRNAQRPRAPAHQPQESNPIPQRGVIRGRGGYQRGRGGVQHVPITESRREPEPVQEGDTQEQPSPVADQTNFKAGDGKEQRPLGETRMFFYNGRFFPFKPQQGVVCNGESKSWYRGGQMFSQMFFVNGKRHGEFKKWHENGKIQCFRRYNHGKVVGKRFDYDENGQVVFEFDPQTNAREGNQGAYGANEHTQDQRNAEDQEDVFQDCQ